MFFCVGRFCWKQKYQTRAGVFSTSRSFAFRHHRIVDHADNRVIYGIFFVLDFIIEDFMEIEDGNPFKVLLRVRSFYGFDTQPLDDIATKLHKNSILSTGNVKIYRR